MQEVITPPIKTPGLYEGISNEAYHTGPGISKSGLWTIHSKTPAHFRFPAEKEETAQSLAAKDFGTAVHTAVLEPHLFEKEIVKGPADRRGNKWKDVVEAPDNAGKLILTEGAYNNALKVRDRVHSNNFLNQLLTSGDGMNEVTGYDFDPITGKFVRVRPDRYRRDIGVICDVKTTVSAAADDFAKSVIKFGYHAQEAFYSDVWQGLNQTVNGFVFIALEKTAPYAVSVYELPPSIVEEGRALIRRALDIYAECIDTGAWPGYPEGVHELEFKRWHYTETEAPTEEAA